MVDHELAYLKWGKILRKIRNLRKFLCFTTDFRKIFTKIIVLNLLIRKFAVAKKLFLFLPRKGREGVARPRIRENNSNIQRAIY